MDYQFSFEGQELRSLVLFHQLRVPSFDRLLLGLEVLYGRYKIRVTCNELYGLPEIILFGSELRLFMMETCSSIQSAASSKSPISTANSAKCRRAKINKNYINYHFSLT